MGERGTGGVEEWGIAGYKAADREQGIAAREMANPDEGIVGYEMADAEQAIVADTMANVDEAIGGYKMATMSGAIVGYKGGERPGPGPGGARHYGITLTMATQPLGA